ncbi:hypothetical protein MKP09_02640 [Niabella ginsengisoli]|uniref:Uncharacterized protein n=2 Tax=Niabella ginsengisoli TaxID=522298 RepID=A0ABS9SEV8_9BACT|nr:STM3941 family protein [Niabella ginsengisoli]MCH5596896.1 hypothetical protein [Niabella ginsengisoli]
MAIRPDLFVRGNSFGFIKIMGYIGTFIFIFCAAFVSQKVFTKKAGLTIDEEGIADNSMNVSFSKVLWKDVSEIKTIQISGDNFITIFIKHPEAFIAAEPNSVKRKMMELNYASLKTPINIAASRLKVDFNELLTTIKHEFEKRS